MLFVRSNNNPFTPALNRRKQQSVHNPVTIFHIVPPLSIIKAITTVITESAFTF